MATYCSQCGRELKDGEVCNCTQNVQETGNTVDSTVPSEMPGTGYTDNINFTGNKNVPLFMADLKKILKNPVETASLLVAVKDTSILKGIWILNVVILFLWALFINWKATDLIQEIDIWYEGIGFMGILKIISGYIVIYFLSTALMALVTRLFDKMRKFTFGQACIITGISGLYGMIGLVLGTFIFMAIFSKIGENIVVFLGNIYSTFNYGSSSDLVEIAGLFFILFLTIGVIILFCSLLSFHIYTESMSSMSVRWTAAYTTICVCRVIVVGILIYFISEYMV